ncbi:unnamed protein product [Ostreobium quekettii]|uniref:Uncharacterized protein n=1 Tax=Ostreobium quekettii TaxID=121088 RepID=A0A8S1IP42_9CHLO|nr:unnamed protein product [Ostreobium quekettii]|eukprot:evm.model.scf_1307EXC.5 EVM.evm.TU.scf_1307EXC.5   scf_1307EXC:23921-32049(-)
MLGVSPGSKRGHATGHQHVYSWFDRAAPGPASLDTGRGGPAGGSKDWHRVYESFAGYQTPARMFLPFKGRKPGLETGDVIKMCWQGHALAICNFLDDQLDGQAQYVFEPTPMENHFDRTSFELEVVKQGGYYAFRAPKAQDRMLQAREAGSAICLLFLNGQMGEAESWEVVRGDLNSHWHRLAVTLRPKAALNFSLEVEFVRMGKYQPLGYASQPHSLAASREQVEQLVGRVENLENNLKEEQALMEKEKKKQERRRHVAMQRLTDKQQRRVSETVLAVWRDRTTRSQHNQLQVKRHNAARNRRLVSDTFSAWILYHRRRLPWQRIMNRVSRKLSEMRLRQSFKVWKTIGHMSPEKGAKMMCLMWVLRRQRLAQCFLEWKALTSDFNSMVRQWNEQRVVCLAFGAWRHDAWGKVQMAHMVGQAMTRRDRRVMRSGFTGWLGEVQDAKGRQTGLRELEGRCKCKSLATAFHIWQSSAQNVKLAKWSKSKQFEKRVEAVLVFVLASKLYQQPLMANMFHEWRKFANSKIRKGPMVAKMRARRSRAIMRQALHCWRTACQDIAASRKEAEDLRNRRDETLKQDTFAVWKEYAAAEHHKREIVTRCEMSKRVAMMYFFEWFGRMLIPAWPNRESE